MTTRGQQNQRPGRSWLSPGAGHLLVGASQGGQRLANVGPTFARLCILPAIYQSWLLLPPYYCMSLRVGQETPVPILFLW